MKDNDTKLLEELYDEKKPDFYTPYEWYTKQLKEAGWGQGQLMLYHWTKDGKLDEDMFLALFKYLDYYMPH